jgi:hypothetical protein
MSDQPRYTPPAGDEPLDELQQALVRMWIDVLIDEMRAEPTRERPGGQTEAPVEPERTGDGHANDNARPPTLQEPPTG